MYPEEAPLLQQVLEFLNENPGANSYDICQRFGITRALSERLLETLEDAGHLNLERPAGCTTGGGGSCGTGGGAAGKLQELAQAARERAAARRMAAQAEQGQA